MALDVEVGAVLDSDSESVFVECSIIRHLAMPLVGWGSLDVEKNTGWCGNSIVCGGLLWRPFAGSKTKEVGPPDKKLGEN